MKVGGWATSLTPTPTTALTVMKYAIAGQVKESIMSANHDECYVTATARMYFTSEEEYVAHWNSFHAAISPWFICPVSECPYVAAGEPDALDWYLDHVAQQHVTSSEGGQLEREGSETAEGTIRCRLNHQYQWPEQGDNFQPCRRALVNPPEEGQPGISVRWQMR